MPDPICAPPCGPNDPIRPPVRPDPVPCCNDVPATPVTGVDCDGNPVVVTGAVLTVPDPTAVQLVRLCDVSGEVDTIILCDPVTGDRVIVVISYDPNGVPITDAYNLDGTPYLGVISALIACSGPVLDSEPLPWCDNGLNVTQWVITEDGEPTGLTFWTDTNGAVIPAPAPGPGLIRGICRVTVPLTVNTVTEEGCADGVPYTRITETTFDTDGTAILTTVTYRDSAGVETDVQPAGWTLGECCNRCLNTLVNQWRASGVQPGLTIFNLAAAAAGVDVVSFTVSFIGGFGTIDGNVTPPGSWTWSAEQGQRITNLPIAITSTEQFYVNWTERS